VCFVQAIEPWKTDHGSMVSINYGFKVHCTGRPAMRSVTTKLWLYDAADGKWYKHAERIDTSTDPDVQALYSASCSAAGIFYGFHTQVEVTAIAGTSAISCSSTPTATSGRRAERCSAYPVRLVLDTSTPRPGRCCNDSAPGSGRPPPTGSVMAGSRWSAEPPTPRCPVRVRPRSRNASCRSAWTVSRSRSSARLAARHRGLP
jgi:hypothetical protein